MPSKCLGPKTSPYEVHKCPPAPWVSYRSVHVRLHVAWYFRNISSLRKVVSQSRISATLYIFEYSLSTESCESNSTAWQASYDMKGGDDRKFEFKEVPLRGDLWDWFVDVQLLGTRDLLILFASLRCSSFGKLLCVWPALSYFSNIRS